MKLKEKATKYIIELQETELMLLKEALRSFYEEIENGRTYKHKLEDKNNYSVLIEDINNIKIGSKL